MGHMWPSRCDGGTTRWGCDSRPVSAHLSSVADPAHSPLGRVYRRLTRVSTNLCIHSPILVAFIRPSTCASIHPSVRPFFRASLTRIRTCVGVCSSVCPSAHPLFLSGSLCLFSLLVIANIAKMILKTSSVLDLIGVVRADDHSCVSLLS